jgi:hypothetical protein
MKVSRGQVYGVDKNSTQLLGECSEATRLEDKATEAHRLTPHTVDTTHSPEL